MNVQSSLHASSDRLAGGVAERVATVLNRHGVRLTIGGEPTFVPIDPEGDEWQHAAVGPMKLAAAWAMARWLVARNMASATTFFAPGKCYPGELNPRWVIWLVQERDGGPIIPQPGDGGGPVSPSAVATLRRELATRLRVADCWRRFTEDLEPEEHPPGETELPEVWALLLDFDEGHWLATAWPEDASRLTNAVGPAGLRLQLHLLSEGVTRRAVVLERRGERLSIFLPPVIQDVFLQLLSHTAAALQVAGIATAEWQGAIPADEAGRWSTIGLSADPGVLEVNLPACHTWHEYDRWLRVVTDAAAACGLRPWRHPIPGFPEESGGGNHLLWGGPTPADNPFFSRPGWVASILRYWQRHPSLSYTFCGTYAGPHSQAPRADESGVPLHDLEWAWRHLELLPPGEDHRQAIADTVRFLQTDVAANGHRSEICFDKFWNGGSPAGLAGLIEFRAIGSLPQPAWSSSVALLWQTLAAWLLQHPCRQPARNFGRELHDRHLLPTMLWDDLSDVLADLRRDGFDLLPHLYREIWAWRFPTLLEFVAGDARLTIRRALQPWPVIGGDGSGTSRFVDTSLHRFECVANKSFRERFQLRVVGRLLPLAIVPLRNPRQGPRPDVTTGGDTAWLAGLRYRRTRLHPSLHPGIPPQLPLVIEIASDADRQAFVLREDSPVFARYDGVACPPGPTCRPLAPGDITCDLRVAE
jgi:uncharacterized protein (DUF2126 family)